MSNLRLSVAIGDYDRNRPLIDGRCQIDGVDPVVMTLTPDETALNGIAAVLSLASGVFPDTANAADGGTRISC